jgi:hypothetical protein
VLVSRGADWTIPGKKRWPGAPLTTPMEIARQKGHHECVKAIEVD